MSYSREKVNWKEEEHVAAENADKVYELLHPALANGIQATDIAVIAPAIGPSIGVFQHLAGGTKAEFARGLIAIGTMLERDNELLG